MALQSIFKSIYKIRNFIINNILYIKNIKSNDSLNCLVKNNREFQNCHCGKRCFILGNGPSLKNENLECLNGEIVFTVNQINRLPAYKKNFSTYHFWVDENFFKIDTNKPEDMELLKVMSDMGNDKTICFFPIEQKEFCERFGLEEKLNIRYFITKPRLTLYDGFSEKIDFTKYLPGYGTVVQYCISMAVYMGFSEIYLLGCDNTGIMVTLKSVLEMNDQSDYAYDVSMNEKKRMENMLRNGSVEQYAIDYANTLRAYRILREYCSKHGISLVNCSSNTVIDSIPREKLEDII